MEKIKESKGLIISEKKITEEINKEINDVRGRDLTSLQIWLNLNSSGVYPPLCFCITKKMSLNHYRLSINFYNKTSRVSPLIIIKTNI